MRQNTGIYNAEKRIHYHYLFKLLSIRRPEGWKENQPCFFRVCASSEKAGPDGVKQTTELLEIIIIDKRNGFCSK